ncbi:hypothetical protein R3X25_03800 [Lutibacter sp. TH_r2]|nr:hypothetical protein [Lutibacter sp. TH_r2]MDV7186395.1 hypothetical protein [Lutibacter sp. TH_r2]
MDRKELFEKKPMIKLHDKLFPCPTSAAMDGERCAEAATKNLLR